MRSDLDELKDVDWFGKVDLKTFGERLVHEALVGVGGNGDCWSFFLIFSLDYLSYEADEIVSVTFGHRNVADYEILLTVIEFHDSFLDRRGRRRNRSETSEQLDEQHPSEIIIFDDKNPHPPETVRFRCKGRRVFRGVRNVFRAHSSSLLPGTHCFLMGTSNVYITSCRGDARKKRLSG